VQHFPSAANVKTTGKGIRVMMNGGTPDTEGERVSDHSLLNRNTQPGRRCKKLQNRNQKTVTKKTPGRKVVVAFRGHKLFCAGKGKSVAWMAILK